MEQTNAGSPLPVPLSPPPSVRPLFTQPSCIILKLLFFCCCRKCERLYLWADILIDLMLIHQLPPAFHASLCTFSWTVAIIAGVEVAWGKCLLCWYFRLPWRVLVLQVPNVIREQSLYPKCFGSTEIFLLGRIFTSSRNLYFSGVVKFNWLIIKSWRFEWLKDDNGEIK